MRKLFLLTILLSFFVAVVPLKVYAQSEFDTEYHVDYRVENNGVTTVSYDITVTNNRSDIVATKYSLSLKQTNIYDISGSDQKGPMKVVTSYEDGVTTLTAELNEQIVGQNRQNNFRIMYKTKDLTSKVGSIWNVNIPAIQNLEITKKYDVTLYVPTSFGPKIFISPSPIDDSQENNFYKYYFVKNTLFDKGITASFGEYQTVNYMLNYELRNNSILAVTQEIALPPDIPGRQLVQYNDISPRPTKVKKDNDGNIMAYFKVPANSTINVTLKGSGRLLGEQIIPESGGMLAEISKDLVKKYTPARKYWESDSAEIQQIAAELKDPDMTVSQNAEMVYKFVTATIKYDFDVSDNDYIERKGSLKALESPDKAACMEFTDLFISIARAMGIPARELNGYAFNETSNTLPLSINLRGGDLLHAWPEYYDPKFGWVAVDPTWGATSGIDYFTKLDTNHFAFVIKGIDSEYPLPAGAYRYSEHARQVEVDFSTGNNQSFTEKDALTQAESFVSPESFSVINYIGVFAAAIIFIGGLYMLIINPKQVGSFLKRNRKPLV